MNRIVTGYNQSGNPAIIASGEPPTVIHVGRYTTTELWVSRRGPITATDQDASAGEWALEPPPGGACFRIVELAPGEEKTFVFVLGYVENPRAEKWEKPGIINKQRAKDLIAKFSSTEQVSAALGSVRGT